MYVRMYVCMYVCMYETKFGPQGYRNYLNFRVRLRGMSQLSTV